MRYHWAASFRDNDLPPPGFDGDVKPHKLTDLWGMGSGRVDDDFGLETAGSGLKPGHPAPNGVDLMNAGTGNASVLAGGISVALLTTAAGLCVGIPALLFHRVFDSKVGRLAIDMEEQALRLVEVMKGEREREEEAS